jgi:hypothetical protein
VATACTAWANMQAKLDPERLVCIEETGTSTNMARLRGRAPRAAGLEAAQRTSGTSDALNLSWRSGISCAAECGARDFH